MTAAPETETETEDVFPETLTAARPALRAGHLRRSRKVWLSSRCHHRRREAVTLPVTGPRRPDAILHVHVGSGFLPLEVLGGNVSIVLSSAYGNVVTVHPAARQTTQIYVTAGCKATITGADPALVTGGLDRTRLR